MSETLKLLGKDVEGDPPRDAVHIAVIPMVLGQSCAPGSWVGILPGSDRAWRYNPGDIPGTPLQEKVKWVGVVDPFIPKPKQVGTKVWVFLFPQSINSFIHLWDHPDFPLQKPSPQTPPIEEAAGWIADFSQEINKTPSQLHAAAQHWIEASDFTIDYSEDYNNVSSEDWKMFWEKYKILTGVGPSSDNMICPYTCED